MLNLLKNKHYLLACSGGPDSMALFKMLLNNNITFDVAFVNYHKRKESVIEEKSVKEYCKKHNIKFHLLDTRSLTCKGNFQAWARLVRYEFFYEIIKNNNLDALLVAHQKDDLIETYIFQKRRKGTYSFYGINEKSFYKDILIIRPILNYRKKELEKYCIDNKVPYFIDSSNLEDNYERNRIRHSIVEKLSNSEINELLKEITIKNEQERKKEESAAKFIKDNKKHSIKDFSSISLETKEKILYILLSSYRKRISKREIDSLIDFIESNKTSGKIEITKKISLCKSYGQFYFIDKKEAYIYIVEEEQVVDKDLFYFDLIKGKDNFFIKDDSYPLSIVVPLKEEKVKIGQINKKVNRLFIDEKIPNDLRSIWPCIKDKNGKIIYFPRKKEEYKDGDVVFKLKI